MTPARRRRPLPDPGVADSRLRNVTTLGTLGFALAMAMTAVPFARAARTGATAEGPRSSVHATAVAASPVADLQPFPGTVPGTARQVISVVAANAHSVAATLRLWQRDAGGRWQPTGAPLRVALGSGGLTTAPSDARPQTPIGTWAMDVVLARDPGITRMPEHVLAPGDGWSSCLTCADYDRLSRTGELWAGRDTWSRVAIHLVTNPGRIPGRSSGVFLHVGGAAPSAGCVGLPTTAALDVARWLDPAADPRIVVALQT